MNSNDNADMLSMFGLNSKQVRILFSIEKMLVEEDIKTDRIYKEEKRKWLNEWMTIISECLVKASPSSPSNFIPESEILEAIAEQHSVGINDTWYYLIILEGTLFVPYTPLKKDKKDDKLFSKLKYKEQIEIIKKIVRSSSSMNENFVDRFKKTYAKSISKLTGKLTKVLLYVASTIAIAAIAAATAGVFAGPIAIALFSSEFVGITGAALTSVCLAMVGGGAIAAGGAGMAGGILVIVGGGALLGLAVGGATVGGVAMFVMSTPELALTQAAKLEVVLKEIVINAQKDVKWAQTVLENYKNQIAYLHSELAKIKLDRKQDKKTIANMKKSIEYMEKAYNNVSIFVSSYEEGTKV